MKYFLLLLVFFYVTGIVAAAELDEAGAVAVLQKLDAAKATDAELFDASAACRRLTVIGTEKSVAVLEPLLADPKLGSYARTALENIKKPEAEAALKRHPAKVDNASPVSEKLAAAMKQVETIAAGGAEADAVFAKLLKSDDKVEFNAALEGFRKKPNVALLAKEQAGLKPERRVVAILSLLDINVGWQVPQPIVQAAASDADPDVRAAALAVLGRVTEAETVLILFNSLGAENKTVVDAAFEALATTKSPVEKLIATNLKNENPKIREACCRLVGRRRIMSAQDALWNSNPVQLQRNADFYRALGRIVDQHGFERLLEGLDLLADIDSVNNAMEGALVACRLASDPKNYTEILNRNQNRLPWIQLELLAAVGGGDALKAIAEIAKKTDRDDIRDQATKILGEWTGAEVAPVLLELSASLTEEKYKVRTLRGFLRAVRQFEMPKDEKKKLCEKALETASREEEKKMVRDVLSKL